MCDVTYVVEQMVKQNGGRGDVTSSMKLILLQTKDGLKTESMRSY